MNATLRNRLIAAGGAGTLAIAAVLQQWYEGDGPTVMRAGVTYHRVYKDTGGVDTVCRGVTGADVIPSKLYARAECDVLERKHLEIANAPGTRHRSSAVASLGALSWRRQPRLRRLCVAWLLATHQAIERLISFFLLISFFGYDKSLTEDVRKCLSPIPTTSYSAPHSWRSASIVPSKRLPMQLDSAHLRCGAWRSRVERFPGREPRLTRGARGLR